MTIGRKKRDPQDVYETPAYAIEPVMPAVLRLVPVGALCLDPCAGSGNIAGVLMQRYGYGMVETMDTLTGEDFLTDWPKRTPNLVMMNPPYSQAQAFVERALNDVVAVRGYGVALLRLAFFEGQARSVWLRLHMPIEAHVLTKRPSFTGGGTDSAAYAWFIWREGYRGKTTRMRLL